MTDNGIRKLHSSVVKLKELCKAKKGFEGVRITSPLHRHAEHYYFSPIVFHQFQTYVNF